MFIRSPRLDYIDGCETTLGGLGGDEAMRLYLSSMKFGDRFADLVAMAGRSARVAVISNATDFIPDASRQAYARTVFDAARQFNDAGLNAENLDLRDFFDGAGDLHAALADVDVLWVNGGNTFLLRRALRQSGLDDLVRRRVRDGSLLYAGWSAGAVVAGPSLVGADLMDDPNQIADRYRPEPIWEGLGLTPFVVIPHFDSDHAESALAAAMARLMAQKAIPYRVLRDGEVLIVDQA